MATIRSISFDLTMMAYNDVLAYLQRFNYRMVPNRPPFDPAIPFNFYLDFPQQPPIGGVAEVLEWTNRNAHGIRWQIAT